MNVKKCSKCKTEKSISEYSRSPTYKDGYRGQCKPCRRSYNRSYRERPGFTQVKVKVSSEQARRYFIKRKYKKSQAWFDEQIIRQNGKCAICRIEEAKSPHGRLCIDHCHKTGMVRGLICNNCNSGIGFLADSTERLEQAIEYLRSFECK